MNKGEFMNDLELKCSVYISENLIPLGLLTNIFCTWCQNGF